VLVRISARLLKETLQYTDERAKLEGELLDGVDVVKCMTWEVRNILLRTICNTPYATHCDAPYVIHCNGPYITYHMMSCVLFV